ncbi:hypothetical protein FRB90_008517, partial [Tulasnella sp. 427]
TSIQTAYKISIAYRCSLPARDAFKDSKLRLFPFSIRFFTTNKAFHPFALFNPISLLPLKSIVFTADITMLTSLFKTISTPTDIEVVHNASIDVLDPEQVVTKAFAQNSIVLQEDYKAPTGFTGVVQTVLSSIAKGKPAFLSSSERTFYLEFLDGGNTEIQVSVADDAPPCIPTFIGVHGLAGDLEAPYLHEILKPLASELGGRLVVFNLRGCGASTATSPTFHHGGSTSDLGAVISWVTMRWPESKVYLIGTSLGGVISAKTLGQWGADCPVSAAALVSPVYDFQASCKAMETAFVARTVFNPAVGSYYARLVKKNIAAFNDLDHWTQTRPKPFAASPSNPPTSISPPPSPIDSTISRPFCRDSRTSSFGSTPSRGTTTRSNSLFSALPTPSTPGTSFPPTPSADSAFCFPPTTPTPPPSPLVEHTEEIKAALAKALWKITDQRRLRAQTLTRFCKSFVTATAHFSSWDEFLTETSAVNDLPNIRVPTLAINCADDP